MPAVIAAREHQQVIDALWDFDDPAGSEIRFRDAADAATGTDRNVLMTQVARALGLQDKFDEAAQLLESLGGSEGTEMVVRLALENGRVINSSGKPAESRHLFEAAARIALLAGLEQLAVDALHMVANVAAPSEQVTLNEQALAMAEAASDPRARDWRASLLNNLGWTYFDAGDVDSALTRFEEALVERERVGKPREIGIARWCVARALRELGRSDEALAMQLELREWLAEQGLTDTYVDEEIAACRAALGPGAADQRSTTPDPGSG